MISLEEEIKKDKEKNQRRYNNPNSSRDRSRERFRNREGSKRNNWDQQDHHDNNRNYHPRNHHHQNPEKTIVKFTNLHYSVTKEQLKTLCEKYGALKFCKFLDKQKETALVGYFNQSDAEKAVQAVDHMMFQDKEVTAELSVPQRNQRKSSEEDWRSRSHRNQSRNQRRFNYNN